MAFDGFLKIDGIDGESTDDKHKNWIEILSHSHTVSQPSSGARSTAGGATAERVDHGDFSIVKALDKTTPKLHLFCSNGKHIDTVKLELCRAGEKKEKYMEYTLTDVVISSVRHGGSTQGAGPLPLEEVSFNYGKIEWNYIQTDHKTGKPAGNVNAHWDVVQNKGA